MRNETEILIHAHGKLLLTGEYAVLDGALALALPVRYGQTLEVHAGETPGSLFWESENEKGERWFQAEYALPDLKLRFASAGGETTAEILRQMLLVCRHQNPDFLAGQTGWTVRTRTDFPRSWGLGASSTLIAALARWAGANPYAVLSETLGGSGYDIACAFAEGPLLYRLEDQQPQAQAVDFAPPFADRLFFVFLGKKQNSRAGIRRFHERVQQDSGLVEKISALTRRCVAAKTAAEFGALLLEHEHIISQALELPRAQNLYFSDFPGVVKSLGAWGGDFVLALSEQEAAETSAYFLKKGFPVCIAYGEMVG